jgi:hypothetical protein
MTTAIFDSELFMIRPGVNVLVLKAFSREKWSKLTVLTQITPF